jgi:hypothetical protein
LYRKTTGKVVKTVVKTVVFYRVKFLNVSQRSLMLNHYFSGGQ